jgi:DNA-binding transcriptional MocR family regulator
MLADLHERLRECRDNPSARGLAHAVSAAVGDGTLVPGSKLPPIRAVAAEFGMSPTTVSAAWALLARSGAIQTDGRRGTVITTTLTPSPSRYRRALAGGTGERSDRIGSAVRLPLDLSTGVPDPALLPDLGDALGRLRRMPAQTYLDDPIVAELADLLRADWPFPAEAFTMTDGAMDALDQLCAQLVPFGARVAVEHPSFPPLLDLLEAVGAQIVPLDLDEDGPRPEQLEAALIAGVRTVFLQPRAQNPTGTTQSAARAGELARIVAAHGGPDALVIENDSAGPIASTRLVSLGQWLPDQVVHIRSFSKSHGPDLRLAAVGGAASVVRPLIERRYLGQGWTSRLLQRVLLDLLTHPDSIAQVRHARAEYARRREQLAGELARIGIEAGAGDGLNVWLPVADEATALIALASRGIGAAPGAPFAIRPVMAPHLRVTAGLLSGGADEIAEVAQAFGAASRTAWSAPR